MRVPFSFIQSGAAPVFDPATLSLTGWWRADYAGAPWAAVASAGSSGSNGNLVTNGADPAVGTAQNSLDPADFDGSDDELKNTNTLDTFFGNGAGAGWCLFLADSAAADAGAGSRVDNPGLVFQDGGGVSWGIGFSDSGVTGILYDGAYKEVAVACGTAAYHLARWRWNGSLFEVGVDSGAMSNIAAGNMTANAGALAVGRNYGGAFFNGRILEIGLANAITDGNFTSITSYVNSRYALSL